MEFFDNPDTWTYKIPEPGDNGYFYAPCINYPALDISGGGGWKWDKTKFIKIELEDLINESKLSTNGIMPNNFITNQIIDKIPFIEKSEILPTSQNDLNTSITISFSAALQGRIPLNGMNGFVNAGFCKRNNIGALFCMPSLINGWQHTEEGFDMFNKWIDWMINLVKKAIYNQLTSHKFNVETGKWNEFEKVELNSDLSKKYEEFGLSIVETKFCIIKRNDIEINHIKYECILF